MLASWIMVHEESKRKQFEIKILFKIRNQNDGKPEETRTLATRIFVI